MSPTDNALEDAIRMPVTVDCPVCYAKAGFRCHDRAYETPHTERFMAVMRALFEVAAPDRAGQGDGETWIATATPRCGRCGAPFTDADMPHICAAPDRAGTDTAHRDTLPAEATVRDWATSDRRAAAAIRALRLTRAAPIPADQQVRATVP